MINISREMSDIVIILDVDHTLVHSIPRTKNDKASFNKNLIVTKTFNVHLRPNMYQFLDFVFSVTSKVIIWSAGTKPYIDELIDTVFKDYKFYKVITLNTFDSVTKDVQMICNDAKVNHSLIIFIDDIPERIIPTANTLVFKINPFEYRSNMRKDNYLEKMTDMLLFIDKLK